MAFQQGAFQSSAFQQRTGNPTTSTRLLPDKRSHQSARYASRRLASQPPDRKKVGRQEELAIAANTLLARGAKVDGLALQIASQQISGQEEEAIVLAVARLL